MASPSSPASSNPETHTSRRKTPARSHQLRLLQRDAGQGKSHRATRRRYRHRGRLVAKERTA
uniref:Uncharacterized protein n=1 Tax=Oryza meridionalis TaxID=40149 RepID=A0A0E0D5E4_9ORYZ